MPQSFACLHHHLIFSTRLRAPTLDHELSASALSLLDQVKAYLAGQAEHHRTVTFQEEFRAFLKRHTIAYDERCLWD